MIEKFHAGLSAITLIYLLLFGAYLALRGLFGDSLWWLSFINTFAYVLLLPLVILLPLALLSQTPQTLVRLLPVMAVGGVWFAPYYLPKAPAAAGGVPLRVVTANVWGNNHDLSTIEDWVRSTDADLVLLQEISPAHAQANLPGLLDAYPYQANQADLSRWGSNTTLSRYPIVETSEVDLGVANQPELVRVVVDIQGQRIAVYNVHLAWPGGDSRVPLPARIQNPYLHMALGFNDRPRNQQIEQLLRHLQDEPYPYIVAGDFNTSDHSVIYGQIAVQMKDSFREAGNGLGKSWPVSRTRGLPGIIPPLVRIDYIWHSDAFQTLQAEIGPAIGSDHLPVLATLELLGD